MQESKGKRLTAALFACAIISGTTMATEFEQSVKQFTEIRFTVGGNLQLIPSGEHRVSLRVIKGDPDHFKFEVRDGVLRLTQKTKDRVRFWQKKLQIEGTVHFQELDHIAILGSGNIEGRDFETPRLRVNVSGSGDAQIDGIRSTKLDVIVNGSGDVDLQNGEFVDLSVTIRGSGDVAISSATTATEKVNLVGSGDFNGMGLQAKVAEVNVVGSGDAHVHATEMLNASIVGSGDIRYMGDPEISSRIIGSGDIHKH